MAAGMMRGLGGGARAPEPPAGELPGVADLEGAIDKAGVSCMNEKPGFKVANLFAHDPRIVLKSDDDEQLIIRIPFSQPVKLAGIQIEAPEGETRPTELCLFVNRPSLTFMEVERIIPVETIALKDEDFVPGKTIRLSMSKFRMVNSLHIWVKNESGSDVTAISALRFVGTGIAGADVGNLKAVGAEEE